MGLALWLDFVNFVWPVTHVVDLMYHICHLSVYKYTVISYCILNGTNKRVRLNDFQIQNNIKISEYMECCYRLKFQMSSMPGTMLISE